MERWTPPQEAADIAVRTVSSWLHHHRESAEVVKLVQFKYRDHFIKGSPHSSCRGCTGWRPRLDSGRNMQVLEAGPHKYILLELDPEFIGNIARQAGFEFKIDDQARIVSVDLSANDRQAPLLLFDAADPGNLGWFSRCQFYVDGKSGSVLQTPLWLGNQRDRSGRALPHAVRLQIAKELPGTFRMPGRQPINEQVVYAVLFNLLNALLNTGVGVCGGPTVKPLAGRTEAIGPRN